jgi:hypothetical protein
MTNAKRIKLVDTPYQDLPCKAPDCFDEAPGGFQINGLAWLRVFAACQGLMSPTGFYGVTHKRCREIIKGELGFCPKGKPGTNPSKNNFRMGGKNAIYEWLGIEALVHDRFDTYAVGGADYTLILFNHDKAGFR